VSDGRTGDGAGILFDIPHDFFKSMWLESQKQENVVEWFFYQKKKIS
jgi:glutamate synthase (ferredoxin)